MLKDGKDTFKHLDPSTVAGDATVLISSYFVSACIRTVQLLTFKQILPFPAFLKDDDLSAVLCEFDAVIEDFTSPVEKRHFRYDEHLKTMKRRSSTSVSDSGISDSESEYKKEKKKKIKGLKAQKDNIKEFPFRPIKETHVLYPDLIISTERFLKHLILSSA